MSNNLIIDSLLHKHEAILAQMKLVNSLVDEWKISKTGPNMAYWKMNLQQSISYLYEGLKQHYVYENEVLPFLARSPLMDAFLLERQTMIKRLEEIDFLLLNISPEGLAPIWDNVRKVISNFSQWLVDHHMLEDAMLKNLKTTLQPQPQSQYRVLVNAV